ncbi:MAG: DUF1524 domain-containing protein [Pedobacter sp.]|nr:MAG: DUF1524 domain-containing protein [Pedobacter sp.]
MHSEKIFINVNKGVKLQDQDLVKGLLVTKIPLESQQQHYRFTENEINSIRANVGRQWDQLAHWTAKPDIKGFFKQSQAETSDLSWLINLTYPDLETSEEDQPLFSHFNNLMRKQEESASQIFTNIRKTMLLLNDWISDPEIKNLLGLLIHQYNNVKVDKLWKDLRSIRTKSELVERLKKECFTMLPVDKDQDDRYQLQELNYEDKGHREKLFNLFLLLDVAKLFPINGRKAAAYDFVKISSEQWSIEHIFPQNADDFKEVDYLEEDDLKVIREMLPALDLSLLKEDFREAGSALYNKILTQERVYLEKEDKKVLEHLLKSHSSSLHSFGNLALLSKPVNSSLSNHFFNVKRGRIVQKVSKGEFVPFHTYDVFSKLIINTNTGLHTWAEADIKAHEHYVNKQAKQIADYLTSK